MNAESDERRKAVDGPADELAAGTRQDEDGTEAGRGPAGGAPKVLRPLGSRAPRFIRASRPLHVSWQVGVFLVGLAVVAAGVVMLPLPGPGWLVIFAGMAVWATEFVWAQLVLRWTRRKVSEATHRALQPEVRRRNIILMSVALVIIVVGVGVYVWQFGVRMPWTIGR